MKQVKKNSNRGVFPYLRSLANARARINHCLSLYQQLVSYLIFSWILVFASIAHAQPTSIEKNLQTYAINQTESQINFLQKLVNINSGTTNLSGVQRVGNIINSELKKLGFKTHWVEEPKSFHRAATLVAERKGQGKRLLLIGHFDTVFPANSPFKQFIRKKQTAKGPGVLDDKGGMVVLLYALKALHAQHALDNTNITIVLTGDEEDSGKPAAISRKPLFAAADHSDIALDFEPAMTLDTLSIGRRGVSQWQIESTGNESHSATIFLPEVGAGAIFESARILNEMRNTFSGEKYLSFNPGIAIGGTKISYDNKTSLGTAFGKENIVAKLSLIKGDFRYIDDKQKQAFEKKLDDIVKNSLSGTHSRLSIQDGIPAMEPTQANRALLEIYSKASEDLGYGAIKAFDPGLRGAGDISYIANRVSANLAGLGPVGVGTHSVIEEIELPSLPIQTARAAVIIYRLTGKPA